MVYLMCWLVSLLFSFYSSKVLDSIMFISHFRTAGQVKVHLKTQHGLVMLKVTMPKPTIILEGFAGVCYYCSLNISLSRSSSLKTGVRNVSISEFSNL